MIVDGNPQRVPDFGYPCRVKIALGQINPTIGDFAGNRRLVLDSLAEAERRGAELLVFPELTLSGYPPKDLLERPAFVAAAAESLRALAGEMRQRGARPAVIVGFPEALPAGSGRPAANAAAVIDGGEVIEVRRKSLLPTYDVFDEWRYFSPAVEVRTTMLRGRRLGISICEDIWNDADFWPQRIYRDDPMERLVADGAEILINISASPFTLSKRSLRPRMLAATARHWGRPLVFVNQVGGQDDLIFDGSSLVLDRTGEVIASGAEHAADLVLADLETGKGDLHPRAPSDVASLLDALTLGTRDYARRCGFTRALIGLSGGIDSAVVACVAVRALGPANVTGVAMPSRYSSAGSIDDAVALAASLGVELLRIPIDPMFTAFLGGLQPAFAGLAPDVTEENLQARIRGTLLMALSNKHGSLLLTTGNKSEIGTGYCTLYGDMCGGLAVISDVPKTMVYELARELNRERRLIPESTMTKPPSAELRPDQTDQDTLPPYEVLDAILEAHVEEGLDAAAIVASGHDRRIVDDVLARVRGSEYKRRQMPPGLKVTGKAFGPGRRVPIAQAWKG